MQGRVKFKPFRNNTCFEDWINSDRNSENHIRWTRYGCITSMNQIYFRNFEKADLRQFLNLFSIYLCSSSDKCARSAGFHYLFIMSFLVGKLLRFFRQDLFFGSVSVTCNEHLVGGVIARRFPFCRIWIVGPVIVDPKFRRMGIGVKMMQFMFKCLKKEAKYLVLSIETSNIQGRKFFEKFNFDYLGIFFDNHNQARKYVRRLAFIPGYLAGNHFKNSRTIDQIDPSQLYQEKNIKQIRTWQIMFTKLPHISKNQNECPLKK